MFFGYLRRLGRQLGPAFQAEFGRTLKPEWVQGLHLTVDRLWLEWLKNDYFHPYAPWGPYHPGLHFGETWRQQSLWRGWDEERVPELLKRHPDWWEKYLEQAGRENAPNPIQIRVIFRSPEHIREAKELPRSFAGYPVVAEARPPCVALANAGDSVGQSVPATQGTLGGVLRDAGSGLDYAVTCAHVCGYGHAMRDLSSASGAAVIGTVTHAVLAPPNALKQRC